MIGLEASEHFTVLALADEGCIAGVQVYTSGSPGYVCADPHGIIRSALLVEATGIILAHNHPSGYADPSAEDSKVWKSIKSGTMTVGITAIDSLVLGADEFYSEAAAGRCSYSDEGRKDCLGLYVHFRSQWQFRRGRIVSK